MQTIQQLAIQILQLLNNQRLNLWMKRIQNVNRSHCYVPHLTQIHEIVY
uniref:CSON011942 protein n=1 Tax=Culicoides sonorensis TaxID=179676 RepID=A0A336N0J8_CULSO